MTQKLLHQDLIIAQELVYKPQGVVVTNFRQEVESTEYGACSFDLNNKHVQFRVGKKTQKKLGFFVTLWKRIGNGPILPFDQADPIDLFIVSVRDADHFGQFVFPKNILVCKGVISQDGKGGKRAIRVYPPWVKTLSKQAQQSQQWQCEYYIEITANKNTVVVNKLSAFLH